jgi:O-antigen/teichoic acid export membrane protein
VLTRLYSPDEFEAFTVFSAFCSILAVGACLRFDLAIPIARDNQDATTLWHLSLTSALVVAVLGVIAYQSILVTGIFPETIAAAPPELAWVSVAAGVFAAFAAQVGMSLRSGRYSEIAKSKLVQSVSMNSFQIGMGLAGGGPSGLIVGFLLSPLAGLLYLGRFSVSRSLWTRPRWADLSKVFRSFSGYPKFSTIEAIANSAGIHVPIILIAFALPGSEAAYVALAMTVLQVPMALAGNSVGQVFLSKGADEFANRRLPEFVAERIGDLAVVGIGPFLFAAMVAPEVFAFVYGSPWKAAGEILVMLTPAHMMSFLVVPVATALYVIGSLRTAMVVQLAGAALRMTSVALAVLAGGKQAVAAYAISGVMMYTVFLVVVLWRCGVTFSMLVRQLKRSLAWVGVWLTFGLAVKYAFHSI